MKRESMRMVTVGLALAASLFIQGCATKYQPQGLSGGFSETKLDVNVWKVTFKGNGYTHPERASDFALLRSAELARENGYSYFIIVDSVERTRVSTSTTASSSVTTGSAYVSGNTVYGSARTNNFGGQTFSVSRPSATNTIVCYREKPDINVMVYNAEFIVNSLQSKYAAEK